MKLRQFAVLGTAAFFLLLGVVGSFVSLGFKVVSISPSGEEMTVRRLFVGGWQVRGDTEHGRLARPGKPGSHWQAYPPARPRFRGWSLRPTTNDDGAVEWAGFLYGRYQLGVPGTLRTTLTELLVPIWPFVAGSSLAALSVVRRQLRRRRRADRSLCEACGYDLRYSEAKCPECGAVRGG